MLKISYRHRSNALACCRYLSNSFSNEKGDSFEVISSENIEDKAWIKSSIAHKVLALGNVHPTEHIRESNMIAYLKKRGYDSALNTPQAVRTLSSLFSFPTTLAYGINTIFPVYRDKLSVCIIGARAEHSLPRSWWLESLFASPTIGNLKITMIGPGVVHSPPPFHKDTVVKWNRFSHSKTSLSDEKLPSTSSLSLEKMILPLQSNDITGSLTLQEQNEDPCVFIKTPKYSHLFLHENPNLNAILLHHDMFVLYHPGLGSDAHKPSWNATLRLLLETRKPIFCTALGGNDLQTDLNALMTFALEEDSQELGDPLEFLIQPHLNPFCSLKRVVVDGKIIINNHSVYAFQAK